MLGLKGQAVARAALIAWLVAVAFALSDPVVRWAQALFLISAAVVWSASAYDAVQEARSKEPQILGGRRLALAFVASLVMLFSVSFYLGFTAAKSHRSSSAQLSRPTEEGTGAAFDQPNPGQTVRPPSEEDPTSGGSGSTQEGVS